jgi:hypothetical protein
VRVHDFRLEAAPGANRMNEVGAKKTNHRQTRAPRRRDILRHGAAVGELLVSPRRVSEAVDLNAAHFLRRGETGSRGRNDAHMDVFAAEGDGESQYEVARGIPFRSRKGMCEKENVHRAIWRIKTLARE